MWCRIGLWIARGEFSDPRLGSDPLCGMQSHPYWGWLKLTNKSGVFLLRGQRGTWDEGVSVIPSSLPSFLFNGAMRSNRSIPEPCPQDPGASFPMLSPFSRLFDLFIIFFLLSWDMWIPSTLTRDGTRAPCSWKHRVLTTRLTGKCLPCFL